MSFDFDALAKKAYVEGGSREDSDNLWSALFSIPEWYFLLPPGVDPTKPQPFITKLEEKLMILAFTDSNLLVKCAHHNKIYKEGDQIPFFSVPIASVVPYLTSFAQHNVYGIWFNATIATGFYAPLENLPKIQAHLQSMGKIAGGNPEAQPKQEPQQEQPAQKQPHLLEQIAFGFYKQQQYLAAAMVFAELAKVEKESPAAWCGLATSLVNSAGMLVRKPFLEGAVKAFKRCLGVAEGTDYKDVCLDWLGNIGQEKEVDPAQFQAMRDEEIAPLLQFLDIDRETIPKAIDATPEQERMLVVMGLGDSRSPHFLIAMQAAAQMRWDEGSARSALKRLPTFAYQPETEQVLRAIAQKPESEQLQPYLKFALDAISAQGQQQGNTSQPRNEGKKEENPPTGGLDPKDQSAKKWWQFWK